MAEIQDNSLTILQRTQFGDPILRRKARQLSPKEIKSDTIQQLIKDMKYTLEKKQYGVGLAAPQVGQSIALTVLGVKATPSRPKLKEYNAVIFNPVITKRFGKKQSMWEGCISFGNDKTPIFAQTLRYPKIQVEYLDQNAIPHIETHQGIVAHLLQHEIDHLQGILFVDRVEDTKSYMNVSEYKKRIVNKKKGHEKPKKK